MNKCLSLTLLLVTSALFGQDAPKMSTIRDYDDSAKQTGYVIKYDATLNGGSGGYYMAADNEGTSLWTDGGDATHLTSTSDDAAIGSTSALGKLSVVQDDNTRKVVVIRGAASQTANLLELQDSGESVLLNVNNGGDLNVIGESGQAGQLYLADTVGNLSTSISGGNGSALNLNASTLFLNVSNLSSFNNLSWDLGNRYFRFRSTGGDSFSVEGVATTTVPMFVKAGTGQTANVFELRDSSNNATFLQNADGRVSINEPNPAAQLHATSANSTTITAILEMAAGQTEPAFAIIDSASAPVFRVESDGDINQYTGKLTLDASGLHTNATGLHFGGGLNMYELSDGQLSIQAGTSEIVRIGGNMLRMGIGGGGALRNVTATATVPGVAVSSNDLNTGIGTAGADQLSSIAGGVEAARFDVDATAGNTRLLIYDVDNATLERVTVGAADSGGSGYKVLRIPN